MLIYLTNISKKKYKKNKNYKKKKKRNQKKKVSFYTPVYPYLYTYLGYPCIAY